MHARITLSDARNLERARAAAKWNLITFVLTLVRRPRVFALFKQPARPPDSPQWVGVCVQAPNRVFSHKTHFTPLLLYALHLNARAAAAAPFRGDDLSTPSLLLFKIQQLKRPRLLSKLFAS